MLTMAAAKAASPRDRAYKLHDAGGLHLHVATTGTKSWRLKFRRGGREQLLTLGRFPALSLADARGARDQAKARARGGVDLQVNTLEQLARAWHAHQTERWSPTHAADVLASLERDVFPELGARPIAAIGSLELLNALRSVERRGCRETAGRLRQRLSAIFGFAIAQQLLERDPAAQLGRAMAGGALARPHPALTQISECRALLAACELVDARASTKLASQFLALTAVRLDAVRGMRWDEIEDLDGAEPTWRVPPARMKLAKLKKGDERFAHRVPLSPQAIMVIDNARRLSPARETERQALVFPARDPSRPIGEGAIGELYVRTGYRGRHVPHGWRASFSTILNEQLPGERDAIDRALAHAPKDKVEAAYNRAEQLARRRALFDRWGELLTASVAI